MPSNPPGFHLSTLNVIMPHDKFTHNDGRECFQSFILDPDSSRTTLVLICKYLYTTLAQHSKLRLLLGGRQESDAMCLVFSPGKGQVFMKTSACLPLARANLSFPVQKSKSG